MTTRFLKFADEAEAKMLLAQYLNEGEWVTASHTHALDPVGVISRLTDEEVVETLAGFHVNFAGELPEGVADYEVFPVTPSRVFA